MGSLSIFITPLLWIIQWLSPEPIPVPGKKLLLEDFNYESGIRTVLFYPERQNANTDVTAPPIIALGSSTPLVLEFDELGTEYHNYYFKIIHCNFDWTKSVMADMEFLFEYNEYLTDRYILSSATRVPYIHYRMVLPNVKLSGNYVVKVYRESDENDLVLTRRFMVYTNRVNIATQINFSGVVQHRDQDQQLDMTINYRGLNIFNPRDEVKVILRQNFRNETAKQLRPLYINEPDMTLDYNYFNGENTFPGGNEYRTFDIRAARSLGLNVAQIDITQPQPLALLNDDLPRAIEPYTQLPDINGNYVIENIETKGNNYDPDYFWVTFSLLAEQPYQGAVYVYGGLSEWRKNLRFRMVYYPETKKYSVTTQLKQGYYNYYYLLETYPSDARKEHEIEGSFSLTNNNYEVFVYTRFIGMRNDELIGYRFINHLGRN